MSAGAVRAGSAYVEIGADPRKFFGALNRVNKALGSMGRAVAGAGAKATAIGVGTLAPFAAAVRQGAAYQSTLLNIQASTVATARASGSRARELHRHAAHDDTDVAGGVDDLDG